METFTKLADFYKSFFKTAKVDFSSNPDTVSVTPAVIVAKLILQRRPHYTAGQNCLPPQIVQIAGRFMGKSNGIAEKCREPSGQPDGFSFWRKQNEESFFRPVPCA